MQGRAYRIRCQFNAMHNLDLAHPEKMHAHTFRVMAYLENVGEELEKIDDCESRLKVYLSRYKGCRLNELQAFRVELPTIENMCKFFYEDLQQELLQEGVSLVKLELGDSPLVTYSIGNKLLIGSAYQLVSDEKFLEYQTKHERTETRIGLDRENRGNMSICEAVFCYWDSL